jgi:hypothetical protein
MIESLVRIGLVLFRVKIFLTLDFQFEGQGVIICANRFPLSVLYCVLEWHDQVSYCFAIRISRGLL